MIDLAQLTEAFLIAKSREGFSILTTNDPFDLFGG